MNNGAIPSGEATIGLLKEGRPLNIFLGLLTLLVLGSFFQQYQMYKALETQQSTIYQVLATKDANTQKRYDGLQKHSFEVDKSLLKLLVEMTIAMQKQVPTKLDDKTRVMVLETMSDVADSLSKLEKYLPVTISNNERLDDMNLKIESLLLRWDGQSGR